MERPGITVLLMLISDKSKLKENTKETALQNALKTSKCLNV